MFLNYIKDFWVKKILKNTWHNVKNATLVTPIKSVGLLVDESYFSQKEELLKELFLNGITNDNLKVIIFRDKLKKNEVYSQPTFGNKHLSWNGNFTEIVVSDFINEKFDLLISYYDLEKAPLLLITHHSKAQFKVGFSSIDKRLNHLMIDTNAENFKVFVNELFKYLKILNKI
jgi:hypothetical protein